MQQCRKCRNRAYHGREPFFSRFGSRLIPIMNTTTTEKSARSQIVLQKNAYIILSQIEVVNFIHLFVIRRKLAKKTHFRPLPIAFEGRGLPSLNP